MRNPGIHAAPHALEGDTRTNNLAPQACVSNSSDPHTSPGNVMRFLWDLYDTTGKDDHGFDDEEHPLSDIADVWDFFIKVPDNTVNQGADEPGDDGRNVRDFQAAWSRAGHSRDSFARLMRANCLLPQAP